MQLDHTQLRELITLLGESDIQELKLEGDDFRLELRRNLPAAQPQVVMQAAPAALPAPAAAPAAPSAAPPAAPAVRGDLVEITAPMVATFYRSSAPGEGAFVEVGSRIRVGQVVCILEAMKLMNEIPADKAGVIKEILVENGQPVEFGQALFVIG